MVIFFVFSVLVLAVVLVWFAQGLIVRVYTRYQLAFKKGAQDQLGEFFLFYDPTQLWAANLLFCGGMVAVIYTLTGMLWPAIGAATLALLAPQAAIAYARRARLTRFDQQLPDLLFSLAGALRAGSGVQSALRHIVMHASAPLSQEFGLMLREQRMGVSFEQALGNLYRRMPTEGTGLVVSALNIAVQSGGNLAETLERIASTLRSRLHLLGRINALTSQGRLQAWVMASLPFALALILDWLDPQSMALLWHSPIGWAVIGVVVVLELIGILFIRRIVNIQV